MANFSDYLEQQLLGVTLLGSAFTEIATPYVALFTQLATTTDAESLTEVTTGVGYGRRVVDFSDPSSGPSWTTINSATVSFSAATTPWGTVNYFGLYDGGVIGAGNLLYWGILDTARDVQTNDELSIPAGNLTVRLD